RRTAPATRRTGPDLRRGRPATIRNYQHGAARHRGGGQPAPRRRGAGEGMTSPTTRPQVSTQEGTATTTRTSASNQRGTATRRTFLQRMAVSGLAAGPGSALLAACATSGDGEDEEPAAAPQSPDETEATGDNPLGVDPQGEVEIFIFDGGFGDE